MYVLLLRLNSYQRLRLSTEPWIQFDPVTWFCERCSYSYNRWDSWDHSPHLRHCRYWRKTRLRSESWVSSSGLVSSYWEVRPETSPLLPSPRDTDMVLRWALGLGTGHFHWGDIVSAICYWISEVWRNSFFSNSWDNYSKWNSMHYDNKSFLSANINVIISLVLP